MGEEVSIKFCLSDQARAKGIHFEPPRNNDAGFDIRALENVIVPSKGQALVSTGLRVAIPPGWVGIVKDRSSMALKRIYTHAGVIDAGYRGEIKVVLSNEGDTGYHIEEGAKIAQMVVLPCLMRGLVVESEAELGATERGDGGFGSTGR